MDNAKRKRLEQKGWKLGSVAEFLKLTPEESAYSELKIALESVLKLTVVRFFQAADAGWKARPTNFKTLS